MVSNILYFYPNLGRWSNLTNTFQIGWNHQLVLIGGSWPANWPGMTCTRVAGGGWFAKRSFVFEPHRNRNGSHEFDGLSRLGGLGFSRVFFCRFWWCWMCFCSFWFRCFGGVFWCIFFNCGVFAVFCLCEFLLPQWFSARVFVLLRWWKTSWCNFMTTCCFFLVAWSLFWVLVWNIYFHPYLGKWSNLTNIFQTGWSNQLVLDLWKTLIIHRFKRILQCFSWIMIASVEMKNAWGNHMFKQGQNG